MKTGLVADVPTTQFPTLEKHVVSRLAEYLVSHGIHMPWNCNGNEEQLQQIQEVVIAWYWTIVYYSRQGSAVVEELTSEATLQRLVSQTATVHVSPAFLTEATSEPAWLVVDLVELLTYPPLCKQDAEWRDHTWDNLGTGMVDFDSWVAEGSCHWKQ